MQAAKLAQGLNSEMEYRLVRANGEVIWVRDSARCQGDGLAQIVYGVVSDITERKQAEEALKVTNKQLQELTNRLQEELTLAREIQQNLLPEGRPAWSGLDIVCYSMPAREVGGDFYAYHAFQKDEGRAARMKDKEADSSFVLHAERSSFPSSFAIAVGDVSGKGMPAALLMAASLTALQSIIAQAFNPSHLLTELDLALKPYTKTTLQNCALCYAEITPPTAAQPQGCLRVANAGCVTPLIGRADGRVEWVEVGGLPLGVGLGAHLGYTEATFSLNPGDLVIFTSDGVIEATNAAGKLFSFDRLEQAVVRGPKTSAAAMLAHLRAEVSLFTGDTEPRDDLTMVVVQV
jgi:serine phosphatase RsbU (regulator of sigma subunit)